MLARPLSIKPLAQLLATAGLLCAALPVQATIVVDGLSATASVSFPHATAPYNFAPLVDGPNTSATSVSAFAERIDSSFNYEQFTEYEGRAEAYGDASGTFGVYASGTGVFSSQATFVRTWDITNDSTVAQNYSFSFVVLAGELIAASRYGSGSGHASYFLDIALDNTSLYSSSARANSNGTFVLNGAQLSGNSFALQEDFSFNYSTNATVDFVSRAEYRWMDTALTLNLGALNPGETAQLRYELVSHAFGDYNRFDRAGNSYANGDFLHIGQDAGDSLSRIGDPSMVSGAPIFAPTITASLAPVPEPHMLALFGLGLPLIFGLRRRQQRG